MPRYCWALQCTTYPCFNYKESTTGSYCRAHAEEPMVDVVRRRRAYGDGCTRRLNFNDEGSQRGMCCRQHAEESMVDVMSKRCAHADGCMKQAHFKHEGVKRKGYCRQHAEKDMANLRIKRCSHSEGCTSHASWGYWSDGKSSVCALHKGDLVDGLSINFNRKCEVAGVKGCVRRVKWGDDGEQPTHCDEHGAPRAGKGLVRIPRGRRGPASSSSSGTASSRHCTTVYGRSEGHDGGGAKRACKAVRLRQVGMLSEEGQGSGDDEPCRQLCGWCIAGEDDENEGEEEKAELA